MVALEPRDLLDLLLAEVLEQVVEFWRRLLSNRGEKKRLTGYLLFCQHHRHAAKEKVPASLEFKAVMPAIAKCLEQMWSKESESNKAAWKAGKVPK